MYFGISQYGFLAINAVLWQTALSSPFVRHQGERQISPPGHGGHPADFESSLDKGGLSGLSTKPVPVIPITKDQKELICDECSEICGGLAMCFNQLCSKLDNYCGSTSDGKKFCYQPFSCLSTSGKGEPPAQASTAKGTKDNEGSSKTCSKPTSSVRLILGSGADHDKVDLYPRNQDDVDAKCLDCTDNCNGKAACLAANCAEVKTTCTDGKLTMECMAKCSKGC